jgi:hypothetical protein
MFKNRMAAFALAVGSLTSVAAPTAALAHDRDDDRWRGGRQERRISERERQMIERQQRIARERYLREQEQRQRYTSPYYGNSARDGYYDRYGRWQQYSYPGYRY